jgi:hypothetical protein
MTMFAGAYRVVDGETVDPFVRQQLRDAISRDPPNEVRVCPLGIPRPPRCRRVGSRPWHNRDGCRIRGGCSQRSSPIRTDIEVRQLGDGSFVVNATLSA